MEINMSKIGIIGAMELEIETLKEKMNIKNTVNKANRTIIAYAPVWATSLSAYLGEKIARIATRNPNSCSLKRRTAIITGMTSHKSFFPIFRLYTGYMSNIINEDA